MARKKALELLSSLYTQELRRTFVQPEIVQLEMRIAQISRIVEDPNFVEDSDFESEEDASSFKKRLIEDCEEARKRVAHYEHLYGDKARMGFVFTKLTHEEHSHVEEIMARAITDEIDRLRKDPEYAEEERRRVRMMFDAQTGVSDDVLRGDEEGAELADMRQKAADLMLEHILLTDGYGEDWAKGIDLDDTDHPEMDLTEAEEEELIPDEKWDEEEKVKFTLEREDRRREILAEKKARIVKKRAEDREERKKKLAGKGVDHLIDTLLDYRNMTRANTVGQALYENLCVYYSIKDPQETKTKRLGSKEVFDDYVRFFEPEEEDLLLFGEDHAPVVDVKTGQQKKRAAWEAGVELIAEFRKRNPQFFAWMIESYNELQKIQNREDAERIARSDTFPYAI